MEWVVRWRRQHNILCAFGATLLYREAGMTLQASGVASSHDVYDALNKWQDIQVKVIQQLYNICT